jgi:hypothetical protein
MSTHNKKKPPVITLAHNLAWRMPRSSCILSRGDGGPDDDEYWSFNFNFRSPKFDDFGPKIITGYFLLPLSAAFSADHRLSVERPSRHPLVSLVLSSSIASISYDLSSCLLLELHLPTTPKSLPLPMRPIAAIHAAEALALSLGRHLAATAGTFRDDHGRAFYADG